jgi:LmbE family N-acetylglucosaminyl deacetylase
MISGPTTCSAAKRRPVGTSKPRTADPDMTLPALPEESFQLVLCVVAHPDDMEDGTSAAVARWTMRGIEVGYLLLTRGEAGMPNPPEETARLRAAGAVVGVKRLTILEHPDGVLVYGLDLRRDICREIRPRTSLSPGTASKG